MVDGERELMVDGEKRGENEREAFSFDNRIVGFHVTAELPFIRTVCEANPHSNTSISLMMENSWDDLFNIHILPVIHILSEVKESF